MEIKLELEMEIAMEFRLEMKMELKMLSPIFFADLYCTSVMKIFSRLDLELEF